METLWTPSMPLQRARTPGLDTRGTSGEEVHGKCMKWQWLPGTVTMSECGGELQVLSGGSGSTYELKGGGPCTPKAQLGPPHLPKKPSLSGSSRRSTSRSCPGLHTSMNWEEREVT